MFSGNLKYCAALFLIGICFGAQAQTTDFPPVIVTGTTTDGGMIECFSVSCASAMSTTLIEMQQANASYPDDGTLDAALFCRVLKRKQPSNCNRSSPPSTPYWDPGWQPNGCGDGSFGSNIANAIVASGYPVTGGTGLDQPAADVYFKPACDLHDQCYGMVSGKANCDNRFLADMNGICVSSNNPACGSIANVYYQAVSTAGTNAYNASSQQNQCAAWAFDMKSNGCK